MKKGVDLQSIPFFVLSFRSERTERHRKIKMIAYLLNVYIVLWIFNSAAAAFI